MSEGAIRLATTEDVPLLPDIERAAGHMFADIGMPEVAADAPLALEVLGAYARDGRAWVSVDADDRAVAYLVADVVDGRTHIEQVSVDPSWSGRGLGRRLIDHAQQWAKDRAHDAVTLTTFADVPFNAPYYERCGFRVMEDSEITPGLRRIREAEAALGLDRWPRVCMIRPVAD